MAPLRSPLTMFAAIILLDAFAVASGPPCWDDVPPAKKYGQHHIVNGSNSQLSADGLIVSTKESESGDGTILVELTVTNCGANAVEVLPNKYDLEVLGPGGPENDKRLARLDPAQFHHPNNHARFAPPLHPELLEYGRIGTYLMFFAPDTYYDRMDHSERLSVVIGEWQFDFYFQKKRTQ
jgi:hypothetical protein